MERGIESFKAAVLKDTQQYNNCFNENGCDHEFYRMVPETNQRLIDMGSKEMCISVSKCSHKYCNKYKWVLDRAAHYAEKTGKTIDEIMQVWETDRSYWYMNYYQECNQPLLTGDNVMMYHDWVSELKKRFGNDSKQWAFVCPACGNTQTIQDFIDLKIENPQDKVFFSCIGRYTITKGCDWTLGGLLQINKQTVIKDGRATPVFEMAPAPASSIQNPVSSIK
jgi:hypothetical protein